MTKHPGWHIEKNIKPIPTDNFNYDFYHDNYDGENGLAGNASSIDDAIKQIDEIMSGEL